jgi:FtsP/CotA-like multicopper oxidase with cupredoxin domain
VRNALPDSAVTVHGLVARPGPGRDSLVIPPGATRSVRFRLDAPGTYLYWATVAPDSSRIWEQEQLAGAIVVDEAGSTLRDRVFVINIWGQQPDSDSSRNVLAINGRAWPHTERITTNEGDTLRWRWVNASRRRHPMHLHGFYFQVAARGDAFRDTTYQTGERLLEVTEDMPWRSTMRMAWSPDRGGQWLFHCHITYHVVGRGRLDPHPGDSDRMSHDPTEHMAGLVLGINVTPRPGKTSASREEPEGLRLHVQEGRQRGRAPRALGYVLERHGTPPAPDSVNLPGTALILTQHRPTDITVVNHLAEATAVHWHGIELESWSDGVAGWSGTPGRLAPPIMPGDSFTAHLTLPRAGTFIHHTHLNDAEQLTSGLYGGIVVLPPGQRFDTATDHLVVIGWDGEETPVHLLLNGDSIPPPLRLAAGQDHRFRLVNIGVAGRLQVAILRDSLPATWRPVAKDGADLPTALATERRAVQGVQAGETYDFLFRPDGPGRYSLRVVFPVAPSSVVQTLLVE